MIPPLALLRHSQPAIVEGESAHDWTLSAEGRIRCRAMARALKSWAPDRFLASREPKAAETACEVASILQTPWEVWAGLEEQARGSVPVMATEEFERLIAELFRTPGEVVFGEESAAAALRRFDLAVVGARRRYPGERLAIVSHGTVMSLYLGARCGTDPLELWRRWETPSFAVLEATTVTLARMVRWDGRPI